MIIISFEDRERIMKMAYGPLTKSHLGSISRSEAFAQAGEWRPDMYTLPFPERLAEFIESYFEPLPMDEAGRKAALTARIQRGAAEHGVTIARNTLNEWLKGGRDPSVSSSDTQTRENIYRLCAALDLDMELTEELFEKVFFSRAFDLKVLREFAFFFFARRDYQSGVEGCRWYATGEQVWEDVGKAILPEETEPEQPIQNTVLLADRTAVMNDREFLRFLSTHQETFLRENRFSRARERIRDYARRACRMTPELAAETAGKTGGEDIPYEPLLNRILGFSQRGTSEASATVSSLKSLPPQLKTNFPTGQILRKICIGDACSYDQVYKMFCLLLFYCYHVKPAPGIGRERRFGDFLRFANQSLEKEGCTELYPRQPFGGLLLFCAAQEDPLVALREFLETAIAEESEAVLMEGMRAVPGISDGQRLGLIRCTERDPFLVKLIAGTLGREACVLRPEKLTASHYYDDRPSEIIQLLYSGAGFSGDEKRVLECFTLLPTEGVKEELFRLLFPEEDRAAARELVRCGWLNQEKGSWSMRHPVRRVVAEQEVAGKEARRFLETASALPQEALTEGSRAALNKIQKHRKSFLPSC